MVIRLKVESRIHRRIEQPERVSQSKRINLEEPKDCEFVPIIQTNQLIY